MILIEQVRWDKGFELYSFFEPVAKRSYLVVPPLPCTVTYGKTLDEARKRV
ncbi:MAG: hypothetical protein V2G52_03210 [bacterium JZ-2024 1]